MSVYGNNIEIYKETVILNEMHFSKKDLEDPKIIEKILNKTKKYKSITEFISIIITALSVLIFILTLGLGLVFLPIFSAIDTALKELPDKTEDKNLKKLKEKCIEAKQKAEKRLKKNPNDNDCKELIKKLNETITKIDKVYTDKLDKQYKENFEEVKKIYTTLERYLKDPYVLARNYEKHIFLLAKSAKIPELEIIKRIKSSENKSMNLTIKDIYLNYIGIDEDDIESELKTDLKFGKEFNNLNSIIKIVYGYDDAFLFLVPSTNKFIYYNYNSDQFNTISLYDYFEEESLIKIYGDIVIDVDKALGYYIFSKCPDNIEQKKFI